MDDGLRDLLTRGIAAAKDGDPYEARRYLERVLNQEPDTDCRLEACYWLSKVSADPKEKRNYLEEILARRPIDARARRELAILDGRLDPTQIVNPDRLGPQPPFTMGSDPQRFTCPSCGGRMTYTPDGSSLVCESCESRQRVQTSRMAPQAGEHDFVVDMATVRGHASPQAVRTIRCQACGAEFILPPQDLNLTCPYCRSVYVLDQASTRELMVPDGLVPFSVERSSAQMKIVEQMKKGNKTQAAGTPAVRGIYQPAWCFTMVGEIPWKCRRYQNRRWVEDAGSKILYFRDILVAAAPRLQSAFPKTVTGYHLEALVAYDLRYLADWPAETYQISMAQASLNAREAALAQARGQIQSGFFDRTTDLVVSSTSIGVESFKLVLLPIWASGRTGGCMLNGQTGEPFTGFN